MQLDTVLLKVASRCNLNCSYCYIYNMGDTSWRDQPAFISDNVVSALQTSLAELSKSQPRPFAVVLHGGEPLLLGSTRLRALLDALRKALPSDEFPVSLQTNGVLISDEVLDLCSKYRCSLSVSLDGPKHVHDAHRVDHGDRGSHDKVIEGIQRLKQHPDAAFLFAGVLAVIDPRSSPREVYESLKSCGAPSLDLLYRDGNNVSLPAYKASRDSYEYGAWAGEMFSLYLADENPTPIRFFDDIVRLLLGIRTPTKEGLGSTEFGILIVEANGTIKKNDTLRSASSTDRFKSKLTVIKDRLADFTSTREYIEYVASQRSTSRVCGACELFDVCGGGMPTHRHGADNTFDHPTVYCADQKHLISHIKTSIFRHATAT